MVFSSWTAFYLPINEVFAEGDPMEIGFLLGRIDDHGREVACADAVGTVTRDDDAKLPFYDWVWRTNKGAHQTTVTITVLMDGLQVIFAIGGGTRARQDIQLTYSLGPQGGKHGVLACCITETACRFVAGGAASWPIPPNTNHGIRVMAAMLEC